MIKSVFLLLLPVLLLFYLSVVRWVDVRTSVPLSACPCQATFSSHFRRIPFRVKTSTGVPPHEFYASPIRPRAICENSARQHCDDPTRQENCIFSVPVSPLDLCSSFLFIKFDLQICANILPLCDVITYFFDVSCR